MASFQSEVDNVVAFRPRAAAVPGLTAADLAEAFQWREALTGQGYDRILVHEREFGDPPEFGSFLSLYRTGEPWARWSIARAGDNLTAWCCLTGADIGVFDSVTAALQVAIPSCRFAPDPAQPPRGLLIALVS